ncbi:hypothetical protein EDD30_0255 [Couchioplanes caeruleus]|uniref:Uncharacterized protein n=1 Tax=Couchioplanes caeruleus TaxID=56438 RepID=A0A3N1GBL5_9ACTN|nr:hypothetical protein EDD30_0255 [Couchioplanes caeruleus]
MTPIAFASRPESVGRCTLAVTTVVSARTRPTRSSFASAALASSASLSCSITSLPHRVVIFIRVVGCGTRPSSPIRQNNRHPIESATSAHNDS